MALTKITQIAGTGIYVPGDDVDTDRIIPARFMKCVTFDGLGEYAFYDERFHEDGKPKAHPIDDPKYQGATILLAGRNFGCGSSREHAPQALYRHGF
ncbi:MAG: isopropylmalate isomerase, partial [Chthoniobacterales bacterium]